MKTNQILLFTLWLFAAAAWTACSRELPAGMPEDEPRCREVSLTLAGEVTGDVDISQEPLSKAAGGAGDLYVINVYSKESAGAANRLYAYGTFDHADGLHLQLEEGYLYEIRVTYVPNAAEVLNWVDDTTYSWQLENYQGTLMNRFVRATSYDDGGFDATAGRIFRKADGLSYYRPHIDRYYGEVTDFDPAASASVTVNLYRAVFGVRLNITGLTEGSLTFAMADAPDIVVRADSLYTPEVVCQFYYPDRVAEAVADGEEYTENAWTTIEWTNDAGDRTVTLHNYTLTYTRVKRSIFNITLEQGVATKGGVNLQVETEDVLDEEAQSFHGTIPVAAE